MGRGWKLKLPDALWAYRIVYEKTLGGGDTQPIAVLKKHRSVLGCTLQDLKGISPALCTHRIPLDSEIAPSREPQ
jgi:hypothetical protein